MPRAQNLQGCQIGVETTSGTAVAANKRLLSTYIDLKPEVPVTQYTAAGGKSPTQETIGRTWTSFSIDGQMSYIDLAYLFSSLIEDPVAGGSPFTFNISPFAADSPQSYTIETGLQGGAGEKCAFGVVDSLRLRFTQSECTVQGSGFGRTMTDPATVTASPTELTRFPISPAYWYAQMGSSIAGLAEIPGVQEVEISIASMWGPVFAADSTNSSFASVVGLKPQIGCNIMIEHTAAAAAYLANLVAMDDLYFRLLAPGPSSMSLQVTMPFVFVGDTRGESQGVRTKNLVLGPKYDGTGGSLQGSVLEIVLTNGLAGI